MLRVAAAAVAALLTAAPPAAGPAAAAASAPDCAVVEREPGRVVLALDLPEIALREVEAGGERWVLPEVPGAETRGLPGRPGLPVVARLLALPEGATPRILAATAETGELSRGAPPVLPVQPGGAEGFVVDRDWYAGLGERGGRLGDGALPRRGTAAGAEGEPVHATLGEPASLAGLRVVPVVFHPVGFEPGTGTLRLARRIEVEIDLGVAGAALPSRPLPASLARLCADTVLGLGGERDAGDDAGPGTWLLIHADAAGVAERLQPLVDWRERQGYAVRVATTAETGTSEQGVKAYIQGVYAAADPPLEFVCLAGDANGAYGVPTWHETMSGYYGEGDHYYTTLDGSDYLADCHVGRLSFGDLETLAVIVAKILGYETAPPQADPGWFARACVAGDPSSSGITTIFVNQWLKQQLLDHGYTQVDTLWAPNRVNMMNAINQGLTVFGYRGYWGLSGLSTGYIMQLANGDELPFAVVPTCGTGSFAAEANCQSEAFLRAPGGGAVAAVGTATLGTHTRYNNCFYNGIWEGAINGEDRRLGVAHTRGKLELYLNYSGWDEAEAEIWSVWNNLMGDPATRLRTAAPPQLEVEHPAALPLAANAVPLRVTAGGQPVAGATVALVKAGELRETGVTDAAGELVLPIAGHTAGTLLVTATARDHLPRPGQLTLGPTGVFAAFAAAVVDDDGSGESSGNGDQVVNPGETIELPVALRNDGFATAAGVTAQLASADPAAVVTDADEVYGDIAPGATVWCAEDFGVAVAADAADGLALTLTLAATDGAEVWISAVELTVAAAAFAREATAWGGPGGTPDPGESGTLVLGLRNVGSVDASAVSARLASASPWVELTDSTAAWADLPVGAYAENDADPFALTISPDCFGGHLAPFVLEVECDGGRLARVEFALEVGERASTDPVGPDPFGYYAFDDTDTGYPWAPVYDWIEIDPNHGGPGESVGLDDFYYEEDDTAVLPLPFPFTYYGDVYDEISVCSNGWIAMGETPLAHFRNWAIPAAGGPDAMIAPFWDNLAQHQGNQVYWWHDAAGHRLVVQWSRMRNYIHSTLDATQNFQLVLYDPTHFPPPTGNGEILFQYHTVANTDWRDGRATVGIQSADRTVGLGYTYAQSYPSGAAPLAPGRAIRIVHLSLDLVLGEIGGTVTNLSDGGAPLAGIPVRIYEQNQTLLSAADGGYAGRAPVGVYTVGVEHESFAPVVFEGVEIAAAAPAVVDFALTDVLGPDIAGTTVLEATGDEAGPYSVAATITDWSTIAERHCYFEVNGGPRQEAPLTVVDEETGAVLAEIPGQVAGSAVRYWLEAADAAGNAGRDPAGEGEAYEFGVMVAHVFLDDDFESDRGWSLDDPGDDAVAGIWVREDPHGTWDEEIPVQPEDDASPDGALCWITGNLDTADPGADDVDDGRTSLFSPWLDLSEAFTARLSYRRWYVNDTGGSPGEDYWKVFITDNGTNWVTLEFSNGAEHAWVERTFDLEDYVSLTDSVRLRFIASDGGVDSEIEAGVDDVRITGLGWPDPNAAPPAAPPAALVLRQNRPNPFNPATEIGFALPEPGAVALTVYDVRGRRVRVLLSGDRLAAGPHALRWDGRDDAGAAAGSGVYLYRLETGGRALSRKMILLK